MPTQSTRISCRNSSSQRSDQRQNTKIETPRIETPADRIPKCRDHDRRNAAATRSEPNTGRIGGKKAGIFKGILPRFRGARKEIEPLDASGSRAITREGQTQFEFRAESEANGDGDDGDDGDELRRRRWRKGERVKEREGPLHAKVHAFKNGGKKERFGFRGN